MRRIVWSGVILVFGILTLAAQRASAGPLIVTTSNEFTGTDSQARITLEDVDPGVKVTVDVLSPDFADIRGVWFDVVPSDQSFLDQLSIIDSNPVGAVTQAIFAQDNVNNLGGGANLNGWGAPKSFDMGFEIGTPGVGKDDSSTVTFTIIHSGMDLDLDSFFDQEVGVRLTSVGGAAGSREGSSKLMGRFPAAVPIPPSVVLLASGFAGVWIVRRRETNA